MRKKNALLSSELKRRVILLLCLFPGISMMADVRFPFEAESDTFKIPSDTTQIDTTNLRENPATMITPYTPPSPQAEAFQRVGEYNVNNPYGIPDISIPLYEIDHHGYKIPITLRYIATPRKSGYNYDVTGHGWALSTGFCISRSIASVPDERADFKLRTDIINSSYPFYIYRDYLNTYNFQRDLFKCNLPNGDSFQFYMTKDWSTGISYTISGNRSINIQAQVSSSNISGFTVTDDSGVIYTFDVIEVSTDPQNMQSNVGWYLSRIDLPNCTTPISFFYGASIRQWHVEGLTEKVITMIHNHPTNYSDNVEVYSANSDQPSYYTTKLLTGIQYGSESVTFSYVNGTGENEFNYLSKMTVAGLKECRFNYNYTTNYPQNITLAQLNKLTVKGLSAPSDSLVYTFSYHTVGGFTGTDHWGYLTNDNDPAHNMANMVFYFECSSFFNTTISNSSLIMPLGAGGRCPYQKYRLYYNEPVSEPRHASPPSIHGVLQSITYPTGGRTEFVFENNRFVTATDENVFFVFNKKQRRVIEGGGFRIKTITNYTSDGAVAEVRQYRYGPTFKEANQQNLRLPVDPTNMSNQHIGFGEPVVDPNILSYSHFSSSGNLPTELKYMLVGLDPGGQNVAFSNPFSDLVYGNPFRFDVQFSPIFFRSLLRGRNAVAYPEITVYYGDVGYEELTPQNTIGKSVSKFDIYGVPNDTTYFQCPMYFGHTLDVRVFTTVNDHPIEKSDYAYENSAFNLKKKETYSYQMSDHDLIDYVYKNLYSTGYGNNALMSSLFQQRELIACTYLPTEKTTTEYSSNGSITTTETYEYTSNDLVDTYSVTGKKPMTTYYTYPNTSNSTSAGLLSAQNRMTVVLESTTGVGEGSSWVETSGYKTDYENYSTGGVLPSRQYRLNTTFSGSSFEEDVHVLSYTANGNPIDVTDRSGMTTVYLWSYKDRYLVAEIKNATLSQVNTALNTILGTNANGLANMSSVSSANLNSLRNHTSLSGSLVTTWTYAPLIGVTSQTDPSGVATYYSYDSLGRLKEVFRYDGNSESPSNKQILNQYIYHTKNQ